eukprot:1286426-Ditylum_brightwellii.AAC.1
MKDRSSMRSRYESPQSVILRRFSLGQTQNDGTPGKAWGHSLLQCRFYVLEKPWTDRISYNRM